MAAQDFGSAADWKEPRLVIARFFVRPEAALSQYVLILNNGPKNI
jgi:hypothetical protein